VTCATAVAHSLMQRLRPRERTKYSWITKKTWRQPSSFITPEGSKISHKNTKIHNAWLVGGNLARVSSQKLSLYSVLGR